ncbi:MAG: GHKL domain-containing protein [Chitinophagales bacterium]|nr:GHKL domain-containing protein [Chitinophagales bacterium]
MNSALIQDRSQNIEQLDKLINLAMAFRKLDANKAEEQWDKAEAICEVENNKVLCRKLYYKKAQFYFYNNVYDKALDNVYKAKRHVEENSDLDAKLLMLEGNVFLALHKFDHAIRSFEKACDQFQAQGHIEQYVHSLYSIGNAFNWSDNLIKGKSFLKRSLDLAVERGLKETEMKCTASIGILATKSREFKIAEYYFERALAIIDEQGDTGMKVQVLKSMGNLYNEAKDYDKAIGMLKQALKEVDYDDPQNAMELVHSFLADSYENLGDEKNALIHFKEFHKILEKRLNAENQARISTIEHEYKTESLKQDAEIHRLKNVELTKAYDNLKRTQQKLIHQEKLALLGQITSGIAHEVQNPLNFVANFAESSSDIIDEMYKNPVWNEKFTKEQKRWLKEFLGSIQKNNMLIKKHGVRASNIVRNILSHAREQYEGKEPVSIKDLLEESLKLSLTEADLKLIDVQEIYRAGQSAMHIYPADLKRVFLNILENAVYAIHEDIALGAKKSLYCIIIETYKKDDAFIVEISNNGSPIEENIKNKLFNPFFTTKVDGEGTGLGLFLCQDIIENEHQGKLEIAGEKHMTCFRIRLPLTIN